MRNIKYRIKYRLDKIVGGDLMVKFPHAGHEKHLCKIWADTYDVDQIRDLVKNAKYVCKVCGRAAAKEENLCDPVTL